MKKIFYNSSPLFNRKPGAKLKSAAIEKVTGNINCKSSGQRPLGCQNIIAQEKGRSNNCATFTRDVRF
ncbi:MAG: hypothetical protein NT027_04685 [Proteobacteria bacterium]|nr:hypothetical protein [Pseudomonadota bacterium]